MKLLGAADKHFKVWKSKANIYLIVDFHAIDFDGKRNRVQKMHYKLEISHVPDGHYYHRPVEEVRNPKTDDGHA